MGNLSAIVKAISERIDSAIDVNDPAIAALMPSLASARAAAGNQMVKGAVYESGTTAITGNFFAIQAVADANAVFSSLTATNWTGDSTANLTLPPGVVIYGDFTAFTLSSGAVVAYEQG